MLARDLLSATASMTIAAGPTVTPITDWGENPTGLELHGYIPSSLPKSPAVILAYSEETRYITYADEKGFIILFPSSLNNDRCWDVSSPESLSRSDGGDSGGLVNIVNWAISTHNADPKRMFVTGSSSGCMMTNVMGATYPDVFAASSCYSGMPAGCLEGSGSSPGSGDPRCARGEIVLTGEEWAEKARSMYPGYDGPYPKTLIWHGDADEMILYPNLAETLKQWSTLMGVSFTKNNTDVPEKGYTQMVYGDGSMFLGYSAVGVGHTVPVHNELDLEWFGL